MPRHIGKLDNQALGRTPRQLWVDLVLLVSVPFPLGLSAYPWTSALVAGVNLAQWLLALEGSCLGSQPALATDQPSDSE